MTSKVPIINKLGDVVKLKFIYFLESILKSFFCLTCEQTIKDRNIKILKQKRKNFIRIQLHPILSLAFASYCFHFYFLNIL